MTNTLFTKKLIEGVVLELGAIITPNSQYGDIVLMLNFNGEVDEGLLSLTHRLEEINPSEP
jgi:hypothetical protein